MTMRITWPKIGTSAIESVVLAGVAAAAIDAAYFSTTALLVGKSPVRVLQAIATFWLGPASLNAGALSALLGAATHVGLAILMACGFALLARRLSFFGERPVAVAGAGYGLLLYALMYLAVMPLRWPALYPRWDGLRSVWDIAVHLVIGISIAWIVRRGRLPIPQRQSYANRIRI